MFDFEPRKVGQGTIAVLVSDDVEYRVGFGVAGAACDCLSYVDTRTSVGRSLRVCSTLWGRKVTVMDDTTVTA